MKLTTGLLIDFFEDYGIELLHKPRALAAFDALRLYYKGCSLREGCLYIAAAGEASGEGICALLAPGEEIEAAGGFAVRTDRRAEEVFELLQERLETLERWDSELCALVMSGASLQSILDCSAPILQRPSLLQDADFNLLAASGELAPEEKGFFRETMVRGRVPSGLFAQLLTLQAPEQPYASPRAISSAVKEIPNESVLIADCCLDGVSVLHFCLHYGERRRAGIDDLILHLLRRIEAGPLIRSFAGKSTDLHNELFAKLIDAPEDGEAESIVSALALRRFRLFTAVCFSFPAESDITGKLTQLRALYPRFWFFRYQNQLFALTGKGAAGEEAAQESLLAQLKALGASCGISLDHFTPRTLREACRQAAFALGEAAEGEGCEYGEVMLRHMLRDFFDVHEFRLYCPAAMQQLIEDDRSGGGNNLLLLYTYLANNCNATAVSRILHMHRNNVLYRIERIRAKYRLELDDSTQRLLLQLICCRAML